MNDTTTLTSYCLYNYEEVKYINECNSIWKKKGKYYERDKTGKRFITACQLFKIITNGKNVDKLIAPMNLTDELLNTQFYDNIEEYKTL